MNAIELAELASKFSLSERLEFVRLVMTCIEAEKIDIAILEGVQRIEEVISGRVQGMTEQEFRAALD